MRAKSKIIKSILVSTIKKQPYKLNFAITSACNSRCLTCNVWQAFKKNPRITKKDLSLKEIKKVFQNLPDNLSWLSLSGGEPFMRDDLAEICHSAIKEIPSLCLITIPTNGLLTKKIIKTTKKILNFPLRNLCLNFSLDGPPEIHNQIRRIKNAFQKTWSTYIQIKEISKKDPRLYVNLETTISKFNLNYLEDFFSKLIERGHKITITIAHLGYLYKNVNDKRNFLCSDDNLHKINRIIKIVDRNLSYSSSIDLIEKIYLQQISDFYHKSFKNPFPCVALKSSIAIDPRGNLIPCFMWGKILGNLKNYDYNLKKFLETERKKIQSIRKIIIRKRCPRCWTPCEAYQAIINQLFLSYRIIKTTKDWLFHS